MKTEETTLEINLTALEKNIHYLKNMPNINLLLCNHIQ